MFAVKCGFLYWYRKSVYNSTADFIQTPRLENFFNAHEILNAHVYKIIKKFAFLGSDKPKMLFFPLINVKMPTIAGIFTFISS